MVSHEGTGQTQSCLTSASLLHCVISGHMPTLLQVPESFYNPSMVFSMYMVAGNQIPNIEIWCQL